MMYRKWGHLECVRPAVLHREILRILTTGTVVGRITCRLYQREQVPTVGILAFGLRRLS